MFRKRREENKELVEKRKNKNKCIQCGGDLPEDSSLVKCKICREKHGKILGKEGKQKPPTGY